jgi:hypothetical protein
MRRSVGALLGLVVVVAALATVWIYLNGEGAPATLIVHEVEGEVSLTRTMGDDTEVPVGLELNDGDRLATAEGGRVVLALGEETRMRLGPTSSIQITAVDETGVRLELEEGKLSATVRPGSGAVRIGNKGREVVADDAVFDVGVYGDAFQAQSTLGSLIVVGTDVTQVEEGEQVTAVGRRAQVGPVPDELLLQVDWPTRDREAVKAYALRGTSEPGSRIRVTGEGIAPVESQANEKGVFVAMIPLVEGRQSRVVIEAIDALGRSTRSEPIAMPARDSTGPRVHGVVEQR